MFFKKLRTKPLLSNYNNYSISYRYLIAIKYLLKYFE